MTSKTNNKWVVKTAVSEEVYTDREEFLDYFYKAALDAAGRRTMSTVLLGQRRMGKTEIFKWVVNRLFFDQDPKDPDSEGRRPGPEIAEGARNLLVGPLRPGLADPGVGASASAGDGCAILKKSVTANRLRELRRVKMNAN